MWLILAFLLLSTSGAPAATRASAAMAEIDYRPERCAYCGAETWCELRLNNKRQCRACKVERYFDYFLYPPIGRSLLWWTREVLRAIYGTVDMATGLRRYQRAFISAAKQNGKSALTGGLPIYHLDAEDEIDPEAYGAAAAKNQAGIVFSESARMIRANVDLSRRFKIIDSQKIIVRRDGRGGKYEVVSADGDVRDGIRGSLNIRDEIHRCKSVKAATLRDILQAGQVSRKEPLDIAITTAGSEYDSPIWQEEYEDAKKVLADPSIAPDLYVRIFEADSKRIASDPEYWKSREARIAANPSHEDLGGHLKDAALVKEMNKALNNPVHRARYFRYHLNVPTRTHETPVIDMAVWQKCGGGFDLRAGNYDFEQIIDKWGLRGAVSYAGVDASWTSDLTSVVFTFPPAGDRAEWALLPFFWMPLERVAEIERICRVPFASWIERGFVTATPGNAIDLRSVLDRIRWGQKTFDLKEVPFDRENFRTEAMNLNAEGIKAVEVAQAFLTLSYATKFLLTAYVDLKIRHANHPVLNWMASCLQLQYDHKDNCQPSKPERLKATTRIDGIQATVTALSRALVARGPSVYATRGLRTL